MMYQKIFYNNILISIFNEEIGCIPIDENNRHYQQYLQWLEEGNEPEPWTNIKREL